MGFMIPINQARRWIAEKRGTYITQSELKNVAPQLNVEFLLTSAKGIYKPAGSKYAFSIRHEPTGGYLDRKPDEMQGIWSIAYDAEIDFGRFANDGGAVCAEALDGVGLRGVEIAGGDELRTTRLQGQQ